MKKETALYRTAEHGEFIALVEVLEKKGWKYKDIAAACKVKPQMVSMIMNNRRNPGKATLELLRQTVETSQSDAFLGGKKQKGNAQLEGPHIEYIKHRVPVISWAAAGRGGNFADLEGQIDEYMDSDCPDPNAYALIIQGDSMLPEYRAGDRVIFLPNAEARNGDIVVARLHDEGDVYFKMFHMTGAKGDIVKLTSYNPMYPPLEYPRSAFRFIHPMYEMRRRPRR